MSDDLIAFIKARLDEDRRTAEGLAVAARIPDRRPEFFACGGPAAEAYWDHFHPYRALLDIEAKRAILAQYEDFHAEFERECTDPSRESMGPLRVGSGVHAATRVLHDAVKAIAATWGDHPDYRPEWKP